MAPRRSEKSTAYRRQPKEEPPRIVDYGPFARRWFEIGIGLGGSLVLLFVAVALLHAEALTCDRARDLCALERRSAVLPSRRNTFSIAAVAEVRWVPYKEKNSERGRTDLLWRSGAQTSVFSGSRDEAADAHRRIDAFFKDGEAQTLEVVGETPWVASLVFAALSAFLLAIGVSAARQPSSLRIAVDAREIVVTHRWFGVPLRRRRFVRGKARDVRVERGVARTFAQPSNQPAPPAARLVLKGGGPETPLTDRFLVGTDVHDDAARALRAALRDEPDPRPRPERADTRAGRGERGLRGAGFRKRLTPPVVAGIGLVVAALAVQAGMMIHADRTQGTLDVTCKQRCRFQGAECLPGGSWRGTFDPGNYTIEVFNPDVPSHWEPKTVTLRLGETTRFTCAPPGH